MHGLKKWISFERPQWPVLAQAHFHPITACPPARPWGLGSEVMNPSNLYLIPPSLDRALYMERKRKYGKRGAGKDRLLLSTIHCTFPEGLTRFQVNRPLCPTGPRSKILLAPLTRNRASWISNWSLVGYPTGPQLDIQLVPSWISNWSLLVGRY